MENSKKTKKIVSVADENQEENRQLVEKQMKVLKYTLDDILKSRKVSRFWGFFFDFKSTIKNYWIKWKNYLKYLKNERFISKIK